MYLRCALCLVVLSGCEALWGHTAIPDSQNCVQTADVCSTGQRCNLETEACESIPVTCSKTTGEVTGTVFIPSGVLPLYNATVYVPGEPEAPIATGPSCDRCSAFSAVTAKAVAITKTDVFGRFRLTGVPSGKDIPLVIRHGKWRRQLTIPQVQPCLETRLDAAITRMPRNKTEGDLPKIALTTGSADAMECWLRKIGIDDTEFTPETGSGRVNLYTGHGGTNAYKGPLNGGAAFTIASDTPNTTTGWWSKTGSFSKYDLVILGCEGSQYLTEKSSTARQQLLDYVNSGGRVLLPHWQYSWISAGPMPLPTVASFYPSGMDQAFASLTVQVDMSSETGSALADWMYGLDRFTSRGTLLVQEGRNTVQTVNAALTQRYAYYNDTARSSTPPQYFVFNTPVGSASGSECGRIASTDLHVSPNSGSNPDPNLDHSNAASPFPTGCVTKTFTPPERALTFLLFELTGCLAPIP